MRIQHPTKHLKHLRRKALIGTKTLSVKIDLAKVQLSTAMTLFESIILPSATYSLEVYRGKITESIRQRHIKILHSIFYKRWAGVPRRLPTEQLMNRMLEGDCRSLMGSLDLFCKSKKENKEAA